MKLNAPTQAFWLIAVILGGLGILSHFTKIPNVTPYAFLLLMAGFIVLLLGTLLKGA